MDLATENWVFLPLEANDDRFEKLRGLTLWPGLSKAVPAKEPNSTSKPSPTCSRSQFTW